MTKNGKSWYTTYIRIHLPNTAFLGNIDPFLRRFDSSHPEILEITANPRWVAVHPVVLSMVAALGARVSPKNVRCEKILAKSGHYVERMGLFRLLGLASGMRIVEHEETGRFIPLTQIRDASELSRVITDMIPLLHLQAEQAQTIVYIISELVRNTLEHAASDHGAMLCAQYYRKSNRISVGIADTGVGIKATINRSHRALTHLEAIRLALWPGITGMTRRVGGTEENAGAGLFFIKSIASANRDFFVLYSGDAMYKLLRSPLRDRLALYPDPFDDRHSTRDALPQWQGTVVGIDVTLDRTEKFDALLRALNQTFSKAIREKRREIYKKPRFT